MDRYDMFYGREGRARQDQMLDLILNYGFLAPAKIAYDEKLGHLLHEAELAELPRSVGGPDGASSLVGSLRHRLGALLIRLGTTLQGASAIASQLPSRTGAVASRVGP